VRLALLSLVPLALLACDLQPPKRDRAQPVGSTSSFDAAAEPDAAVAPPAVDAAPPASDEPSEACSAVAVHIAQVLIEGESDATQKAMLEQERTRIVRSTAENCHRSGWSDAARTCFLGSKTRQALEDCGRLLAQ
jgi:hypothetical protein